ncbi:MAG: multiheme c-type cytochrome, partial [Rubripirellula sp.]
VEFEPLDPSFVGSHACRECHPKQFQTFGETTHAISLRSVGGARNVGPKSGGFFHEPSNRRFEVSVDNRQIVHREVINVAGDDAMAVTEFPMAYEVGSGTHAHTYLFSLDGFLQESPLTWYRETDDWGMSPGYDQASHHSFTRKITTDCMFCHAGRIQRQVGNQAKFRVAEEAISCERCHGPGDAHAELHGGSTAVSGDVADPIINPGKLSRELGEAICQQCHLQAVETVSAAGVDHWSFRPGERLETNRTDYRFENQTTTAIVGHVEQMHLSECYLQTETLTCISCHDPHHQVTASQRIDYYRNACLECHANRDCGVELAERMESHSNACADCHMPKNPTNVTHAALHNHRIGIYPDSPAGIDGPARLVPVIEPKLIDRLERLRRQCVAVHKYIYGSEQDLDASDREAIRSQHEESTEALLKGLAGQPTDPATRLALAFDAQFAGQSSLAVALAGPAIEASLPGSSIAIDGHDLIAQAAMQNRNPRLAAIHFRKLIEFRNSETDHFGLAICLLAERNTAEAISHLEKAVSIRTDFVKAHQQLAELLSRADPARAARHRAIIESLNASSMKRD